MEKIPEHVHLAQHGTNAHMDFGFKGKSRLQIIYNTGDTNETETEANTESV